MSTLRANIVEASTDDTNLEIKGRGTGRVKIGISNLLFPNGDGADGQGLVTDGSANLVFRNIATIDAATAMAIALG